MVKDGKGGSNTLTGLNFEEKVDFLDLLKDIRGYTIQKPGTTAGSDVYFEGNLVAKAFKKHDFYRFLEENNIDWQTIISKKLLPDDALLVIVRETLFILLWGLIPRRSAAVRISNTYKKMVVNPPYYKFPYRTNLVNNCNAYKDTPPLCGGEVHY